MIGDKKKLRDGRRIVFTKANPTTTFNAVVKYAKANMFEIQNFSQARTGSKYIRFTTNNGLDVDIRCSNHSKGTYDCDNLDSGIDFDGDCLSIDLALAELSAKDILRLIKECEIEMLRNDENSTDKDYMPIYDKSAKEAVMLFPFPQFDVCNEEGAIYHFGENITVDVDNTHYVKQCINSGVLSDKELKRYISDYQQNLINGYSYILPNGMQIKKDRQEVIAQRRDYVRNKLNESVSSILRQVLAECKKASYLHRREA